MSAESKSSVAVEPVPGQIGLIEEIERVQREEPTETLQEARSPVRKFRTVDYAGFVAAVGWPWDTFPRDMLPPPEVVREVIDIYRKEDKEFYVEGSDVRSVEDYYLDMEDTLGVSLQRA